MKSIFFITLTFLGVLLVSFSGFYAYWNNADPVTTCASCHEITPSVATWQHSAHRNTQCFDCHGTALENGIHSLREKANMVFEHARDADDFREIKMTEMQVLLVSERCKNCHQSEYSKWQAGRHSTTYSDIFLNPVHNAEERLYWDCFRCHGMFYEGNIYDLVSPVSKQGPWKLKDESKTSQPAIPCLACHQVHTENEPYESLKYTHAVNNIPDRNPHFGLFLRSDKIFLNASNLPKPNIYLDNRKLAISNDPTQALCTQCHAPGAFHNSGSNDDRTPSGVHEGISCNSCHEPHSNNPKNSCDACHPAISNCNLDVKTMNTSYANPGSVNNIHSVSCTDCHSDYMKMHQSP